MADLRLSVEPAGRTEFGPGAVAELPASAASLGHSRAFVVTDRGLRATGIVGRVERIFADAGVEHAVHEDIGPNPSTLEIERGSARLRSFGDAVVVALGGGSALDAAKAISWQTGAAPPVIAVPTTAGTGAETNGFGVIEDVCAHRKVYVGDSSVKPRITVLDPELTVGLPPSITAATGLDALVHGIESLASRQSSPISAAYATEAVALVGRWLPVAYRDGADLEARSKVMLGAHLAGRALTLSGLGLVHGLGHALTAHTGTPHGVALAAVLEEVMVFSAAAASEAYETTARALRVPPARDWTGAAIEAVREISGAIGIKRPLRELGATRELLPSLARDALADAVTSNAPREPTAAEALELLESVY